MNMNKKIFSLSLLISLLSVFGISAQTGMTAVQVLDRTVAKITNAKGCEAAFKVYNSGYSGSGSIVTSGNKFKVVMPDVQVWYNGKDLYTYNKKTSETTVVTPTAEELAQSNPLAYVTEAKNKYNVAYSTVKKEGRLVLELTPKGKGTEIKRITLTVKKSDYLPEKIVVEPVSGNPISADITGFKTSETARAADFEYPASKFSKIEMIDLR